MVGEPYNPLSIDGWLVFINDVLSKPDLLFEFMSADRFEPGTSLTHSHYAISVLHFFLNAMDTIFMCPSSIAVVQNSKKH